MGPSASGYDTHMTDSVYSLPDLPYDPGALEPHISGRIMELHHDKHHATYVKGANTALDKLSEIRGKGDFSSISMLEKNLAFNVSGHVLHSVFWTNLSPNGGGQPDGDLATALEDTVALDVFNPPRQDWLNKTDDYLRHGR